VPEIFKSAAVTTWQLIAGDPGEFPDRSIEKRRARFRQVLQSLHAPVDLDPASELAKIAGQRVRNRLGAGARDWPTDHMTSSAEYESERG